jgi:hypothetical protein
MRSLFCSFVATAFFHVCQQYQCDTTSVSIYFSNQLNKIITLFVVNCLKMSGNSAPPALTVSNSTFCIYEFYMFLNVNKDYFPIYA